MFNPDPLHHHYSSAVIFPPPPGYDQDFISAFKPEFGYTSSGCSSYGGSPTLMHSSLSTSHLEGYFEVEPAASFRKAMSTGDLQVAPRSSAIVSESSIIESMNRANPYSPEEKKERIERYRSKKNLRNYNKKIKYECRKTLADSRPRIRGRFARNEELEKTTHDEDHEDDDVNWIHFLDA